MTTDVVGAYRSFIRARLRERACKSCGSSLEYATLVSACDGTTLDEYGLSDTSVASVLAATEHLTVQCDQCGASADVGAPLVYSPPSPAVSGDDLTPWSPAAVAVYRSIIHERLAGRMCTACSSALAGAEVTRAAGGATLPEFAFDDVAAVALIAWTQRLSVQCPQCSVDADL